MPEPVRLEKCGYCGVMYDPAESDAPQRYSFHSEECQRLYRPGIAHAYADDGSTCSTGLCHTPELCGLESVEQQVERIRTRR